jgi:hypothetical protein
MISMACAFLYRGYMEYMGHRIPRPQTVNMLLAVPIDIRSWLEAQATRDLSPMSSVIIAAVRRQMDADQCQGQAPSGTS